MPNTPVELLGSAIAQCKDHIQRVNKFSCDDVMSMRLLAALELAKVDAELHMLYEHGTSDGKEFNHEDMKLRTARAAARVKLYEILQR